MRQEFEAEHRLEDLPLAASKFLHSAVVGAMWLAHQLLKQGWANFIIFWRREVHMEERTRLTESSRQYLGSREMEAKV